MSWDGDKPKEKPTCPKCGNRLRLRADQVGTQVKCPKCNHKFTVGEPAKAKAAASPDDEYEPEVPLKRAAIVHEDYRPLEVADAPPTEILPMTRPDASYQPKYTADWTRDEIEIEAPQERPPSQEPDYLEIAKQRGLLRQVQVERRPRSLFFSGVFSYPWQPGGIGRWAMMSAGLTVTALLVVATVQELIGGVRNSTLLLPMLSVMTASMSLVTFACCAPCFLAAVDDTADGHYDVQEDSLPPLDQWFFSLLSLLWIWLTSGALGYPLVFVPGLGPPAILVSSLLLFPVLTLSAMECDSFLFPLSGRIWQSLLRHAGTWLAFYLVSSLVLAAWYVPLGLALPHAPYLVALAAAPALAAVILIYARLLGRLGWQISGGPLRATVPRPRRSAPPIQDAPQIDERPRPDPEPPAAKKKKKVRRINIPDPADAPAPSAGQSAAPRLDFHRKP